MSQDKLMRVTPQPLEVDPHLPADPTARLVYYARMAPSTHNSQPWKFTVQDGAIGLFADLSRWLKAADPARRELYLSLGCALETMLIAGDFTGLGVEIEYFPVENDDTYICSTRYKADAPRRDYPAGSLLSVVARRHTSHRPFEAVPIGEGDLTLVANACDGEDVAIHFSTTASERSALIDLLDATEAALFGDAAYRSDLARWIGSGAAGAGWLKAKLTQFAIEHRDAAKLAHTDAELLASAPVIAVLSTVHNRRIDEVRAGQAYARAALNAENHGLRTQPFSALTANRAARDGVKRIVSLGNRYPQLVFRLGRAAAPSSRTPRRALADVLVAPAGASPV